MRTRAFSPSSVTCFFVPSRGTDPERTVSRGVAINLSHGVRATVDVGPTSRLTLSGSPVDMPCVQRVCDALAPGPVDIQLDSDTPIGCGFGVSAAAALSVAFAINARFSLGLSREELGMVAHVAEVSERTGIGDVGAQLQGGAVWRKGDGGPFDCVQIDVPETEMWWYACGPMSTREILDSESRMSLLAAAGQDSLAWVETNAHDTSVAAVLDRGLSFAKDAGLLSDDMVQALIQDVRHLGGSATMALLGQTVIATRPPEDSRGWHRCTIDVQGARLLP